MRQLDLPINDRVLVVLSGGQDSVTCLGYALQTYSQVFAIGFGYGQRHSIELEQARLICERFLVPFRVLHIPALAELSDSALIDGGDLNATHAFNSDLPASFVPCRNTLMLTLAHAYAQHLQAHTIITGVCETDYSGYPDCRQVFIDKLQDTLNTGYQTEIKIETPLMFLDKAATFAFAEKHRFLETVIHDSHTCYKGDRSTRYDWGYGCGDCPACKLRAAGYKKFREMECAE